MSNHLRDYGPLPEETLRTLSWINEKDRAIGTLIGNVQNLVGAIELTIPKKSRSKYLQDRIDQAKEVLAEYRADL